MPHSTDNLPDALYSAAQVRALDARLIAAGTPGFTLMNRAAHALWRLLRQRWPDTGALTVMAGGGNNAGDGYLVAELAQRAGWRVQVHALGEPAALRDDAARAYAAARDAGVAVRLWDGQGAFEGVLLDALLGTGLRDAVRTPYAEAIAQVNASGLPVLAVDIPSGLCADTGCVLGSAVRADVTLTLIGLKLGLLTGAGPDHVGNLLFDALQADPIEVAQQPCSARRLTRLNVQPLPARARSTHKGQLGHVLVVGGDHGMGGAALLAAQSALRSGAGMVSLATREAHQAAAQARLPEVMAAGIASGNQLLALGARASVWLVGPGLGQQAWSRSLLSVAAASQAAQVWDADALNLLALGVVQIPAGSVVTPPRAEAARLLSIDTAAVQADRPAAARALAARYQVVCVLKGVGSLVAEPEGALWLCDHGDPVMAGAGLGDVLAGLIGALRAQGLSALDAARLGVWLHARAGEFLSAQGIGLAASDLCAAIRHLLQELGVERA